jgi:hypothetical protein
MCALILQRPSIQTCAIYFVSTPRLFPTIKMAQLHTWVHGCELNCVLTIHMAHECHHTAPTLCLGVRVSSAVQQVPLAHIACSMHMPIGGLFHTKYRISGNFSVVQCMLLLLT